jgi:LAO/AO transport system kinase
MTGPGGDGSGSGGDADDDRDRDRDRDRDAAAGADDDVDDLVAALLAGEHRALARAITRIENRAPGYRDLVAELYRHGGDAEVIGVTGSPGSGKSTLVDKLARAYRDRGLTVGVVAVDPSSPYTGGAVLGDRIRMGSTVGDMDVFVRSMSARGRLGGLATATADAVVALDAFGKDRIVVETVGAGQNEVDVVRTADTVAVLVQPGSGDDVQMLKAGILEIGDVFAVNKADLDGADRTVAELEEMVHAREGSTGTGPGPAVDAGHHGAAGSRGADLDVLGDGRADAEAGGDAGDGDTGPEPDSWTPPVVRTVATTGEGVAALLDALDDHRAHLERTDALAARTRERHAEELRRLLRADVRDLVDDALERRGGVDALAERVARRESDPYSLADEVLAPIRACLDRDDGSDGSGS